jgi:predicted phosphodiesterase
MAKLGIIGDLHCPWSHPGYRNFCQDLFDKFKCDGILFIGDVVDWHSISFHNRRPDAPGPLDEYENAKAEVAKWHKLFPKARVCVGNHDERVIRLAETVNIPAKFLKDYWELWETPGWKWQYDFMIDQVRYIHGTGTGGVHPAFTSMTRNAMSIVQGHIHSASGIKWRANTDRRIFGLDTGCGVDDKAIVFAYNKNNPVKSVLSAAVVLDGTPQHFIMPAGPGEKYHHSRFKKGRL